MSKVDVVEILKKSDALLEGHFLLSSGKHSNRYVQCAKVLRFPQYAEQVLSTVVEQIKDLDIDKSTFYLAELEDTPFSIDSTIANIKKDKDGNYKYRSTGHLIFPDFAKNGYAGGNNPTHVESGISIGYLRQFLTLLHKNELGTNNTLLINEDYQYITKKRTTWVKDTSQHAGDFCVGAYFATDLKFRDER